jgi:hypothetical protein
MCYLINSKLIAKIRNNFLKDVFKHRNKPILQNKHTSSTEGFLCGSPCLVLSVFLFVSSSGLIS